MVGSVFPDIQTVWTPCRAQLEKRFVFHMKLSRRRNFVTIRNRKWSRHISYFTTFRQAFNVYFCAHACGCVPIFTENLHITYIIDFQYWQWISERSLNST